MPNSETLPLTVHVPASEWNDNRTRVAYLETMLIGVAEHSGLDDDWHDVERLAGLWGNLGRRLPKAVDVPLNTVVPSWVMPLLRLLRGPAAGDISEAWAELPHNLPKGVTLPTDTEAAAILLYHGLV